MTSQLSVFVPSSYPKSEKNSCKSNNKKIMALVELKQICTQIMFSVLQELNYNVSFDHYHKILFLNKAGESPYWSLRITKALKNTLALVFFSARLEALSIETKISIEL